MKTKWALTQAAFDNLLSWLSPDREEAGRKYEEIRRRLIRLFNCRGCDSPEELADDTINRVIKILDAKETEYSGDPILLFFGVARKVFLEWSRKRGLEPKDVPPVPSLYTEQELECLDECMWRLPERGRSLIIRYYEQEGRGKIANRQKIAAELGLDMNVLRIQVCRIRKALRDCVFACIQRKAA